MIVVMKPGAAQAELDAVKKAVEDFGYKTHIIVGVERTVVACLGDERGKSQLQALEVYAGVDKVMPILSSYKLAGREIHREQSVIAIAPTVSAGGKNLLVIAGPCSVESEEQIVSVAKSIKASGANALRGGAFKPRSSVYSFQGLGEEGLKLLRTAKQETGLPIVTEIMDHHTLDLLVEYADVLQVGARNMQNFSLLKALGDTQKPVLLKRGLMATIEELLQSAEYILASGNPNVILCERGIRTFETATRNTLDLNAVPAIRERSHLPILVDPSHGTGVSRYVPAMCKAAVASGAHGLVIEVHPKPSEALSDGPQSLNPIEFDRLMKDLRGLANALGVTIGAPA